MTRKAHGKSRKESCGIPGDNHNAADVEDRKPLIESQITLVNCVLGLYLLLRYLGYLHGLPSLLRP